jgi:HK97 family phage prohead protease
MNRELRYAVAQELRAAGTDSTPRVEGYAATFGAVANLGSFKEVIRKGAFKRTLASDTDDVVLLLNHDQNMLLGRKSAGTLQVEEDAKGLRFSCTLPETSAARDVYINLKSGNLRSCSFGFGIDEDDEGADEWERMADGTLLRTLKDISTLYDVSVVTSPAYPGTSAAARNIVSPRVEARMATFAAQTELEARRKRVQSVLNEHNAWLKTQETAEAEIEARRNHDRVRLAVAKLTL